MSGSLRRVYHKILRQSIVFKNNCNTYINKKGLSSRLQVTENSRPYYLKLSDNLTEIKTDTFSQCAKLTGNLVIPNGITRIGNTAFFTCAKLTGNLTIPDSVTNIGFGAFDRCVGFDDNLKLSNNLTSIQPSTFSSCKNLKGTLHIPDSVTSIGSLAFFACSGLTGELSISDNVTSIRDNAFENCSGFTGVIKLKNSNITIGKTPFTGCSGITDLYVNKEDSVTTGFPNKIHWAYDLSNCTATLQYDTFTYTGKVIKPTITVVSPSGNTLCLNEDYVMNYENNINAGQSTFLWASALTDGISYNTTDDIYFTINPKPCDDLVLEPIPDKVFSGVAHTPDVIIKNIS